MTNNDDSLTNTNNYFLNRECYNCINCSSCLYCINCKNCTGCIGLINCVGCLACAFSANMAGVVGTFGSINICGTIAAFMCANVCGATTIALTVNAFLIAFVILGFGISGSVYTLYSKHVLFSMFLFKAVGILGCMGIWGRKHISGYIRPGMFTVYYGSGLFWGGPVMGNY